MAKKSYQKLTAHGVQISEKDSDTSEIILKGTNAKGTEVVVKAMINDYEFPYIIRQMTRIGKAKMDRAISRLQEIKNAVNQ